MTTDSIQHAARLVHVGATSEVVDEAAFQALAGWLTDAVEAGADQDLAEVTRLARADSVQAERYLNRVMRVVGGAQPVELVAGTQEWLHLLAIPLFIYPRQTKDVSEVVTHLEVRAEIERSLEQALGLDFTSIRLCDHPVSAIDLEALTMSAARKVCLDLLNQGDSAYLVPPVLDVGDSPEAAHHQSLLWPAVWKVSDNAREAQMSRISGALHRSRALSHFKHRADELIEQELLTRWGMAVRADVYMPAFFHDALSVFRIVELNVMLNQALHQFKARCHSVSFGVFGNRLRYTLHDVHAAVLTSDELKAPEESIETVTAAVRAACARHGVACTVKPVR